MSAHQIRNTVLPLVGLAGLAAYILACTSFSPDDKKVLYPAFDPVSGRIGVALFDRPSRQSEMLFVPMNCGGGTGTNDTNAVHVPLLRPQWLADGRRALVAWAGDSSYTLLLAPVTEPGSIKLFFDFPGIPNGADDLLTAPIPVVGDYAFIRNSKQEVVRLDLRTGKLLTHSFAETNKTISLWPGLNGKKIFYLDEAEPRAFGEMNPETFELRPLFSFTNQWVDCTLFAYDDEGRQIAFVERAEPVPRLVVLDRGRTQFSRPIGEPNERLSWGNAMFSRKRALLLASYEAQPDAETNAVFGLMEIPLNGDPIRQTPLLRVSDHVEDSTVFYFQIGFSHDEKYAAVASTYFACDRGQDLKPQDCALFLIDLSCTGRKVTRVPIVLPDKREQRFLN